MCLRPELSLDCWIFLEMNGFPRTRIDVPGQIAYVSKAIDLGFNDRR